MYWGLFFFVSLCLEGVDGDENLRLIWSLLGEKKKSKKGETYIHILLPRGAFLGGGIVANWVKT